jgi:hypothetical protein
MNKYFVFFILLFSFYTFAGEPKLKIELANKDNNLRLYLINYGDDVLINKRFSFVHRPPSGIPEIEFEIENKEGKKFPFSNIEIFSSDSEEENTILLRRGDIIGHEYPIDLLCRYNHLNPGRYKARVKYVNTYGANKGVFNGRLTSNWVTFEVPEKKENIVWPEDEWNSK